MLPLDAAVLLRLKLGPFEDPEYALQVPETLRLGP